MVVRRILIVVALISGSHLMMAQPRFGLEYNGELQSDFKGGFNFPNLLRLEAELPLRQGVTFEAASLSISKTSAERLVDDLQTFSNIEEDNLPFALAVLGASFQLSDGHSLFVGIRDVNEDYFTSPVTSLFTNSSCGIFPTISCNYPIANYPLSSLGLHYAFESEHWETLASIYNGKGYMDLWGKEHVFRFSPVTDGVFIACQSGLNRNGSSYYLGGCLHTSPSSGTVWGYAEQRIIDNVGLIMDCSHAFGPAAICKDFFGLGARYVSEKAEIGLFTDYAGFSHDHEWATELTCLIRLSEHVSMQPALHVILQRDLRTAVCLVRLSISI